MSSGLKKIIIRLPSSEEILYFLSISAFILIIIYLLEPDVVVPLNIKPIYREYSPTFLSDFVFFFYPILVAHSAFKPIWFILWPVFFYCLGKKFFKKRKIVKYHLLIAGILFAYAFYAIPNHSIVSFFYVYKPSVFSIEQQFHEVCEKKNVMVFAPPKIYLLEPSLSLDVYTHFRDDYSNYVSTPINYVCVGNGTSVDIGFDWNPDKLNCPANIGYGLSTGKYKEILGDPSPLFPMIVLNCKYVVSPHPATQKRKEWIDIFCFHSSFLNLKCFFHLLNPSTGVFVPPKNYLR